ncbi:MAG TPA: hypothetical protein VMV95_04050 [Bacillota bacterium]|nr:hypothetical protein [Bacillota bacterium]
MGVLEQVMELKGRGTPENEIAGMLREQGVSPNEINNALSQARIKNAVSSEENVRGEMEPSIMGPEGAEPPPKELPTEGRVADVDLAPIPPQYPAYSQRKSPVSMDISNQEEYVPQPQEEAYPNQEQQYQQPQYQPEEYMPQEYAPQEEYGYSGQGISDTDTLIEIAEQVFSEKIKPLQKQVEDLNEFRILAQTKIDNISDRLKRIESNIDRLQAEILEKVGSYGRGLENVRKEMGMVQESFGKIVNTLADKKDEKRQHHSSSTHTLHQKTHSTKKRVSKPIKKSSRKKR